MEQLMSDAISYASVGRGLPVAQLYAEVCLDPDLRSLRSHGIAPQMSFPSASNMAKHILLASPISLPSASRYYPAFLSQTVSFQNT